MIKTWQERCEEHPDHNGIVTNGMIQARMQEEIDELREANEAFAKRQEWWNDKMFELEAELQRYKTSAAMWRNKAYEAAGHPLPWEPDELWQGLTEEEILKAVGWETAEMYMKLTPNFPVEEARKETVKNARAIEAKLKEKNT